MRLQIIAVWATTEMQDILKRVFRPVSKFLMKRKNYGGKYDMSEAVLRRLQRMSEVRKLRKIE